MKAPHPLGATGFDRRSLSFPRLSRASSFTNRSLLYAVQHGKMDQIDHFVGTKGNLNSYDALDRPLISVAETTEFLCPKQKDDVISLLRTLPGRLAVLGDESDNFVGLKSNENRWKHKHAERNKTVLRTLRKFFKEKAPERDWSLELCLANPSIFALDPQKLMKSIPMWIKQVGVPSTISVLYANPHLGHSDPERILDVAPKLSQMVGQKDVALYFLSRQPTLFKFNQRYLRNAHRALTNIFDDKHLVLFILKQTTVPVKISMVSNLQSISSVLGDYYMMLYDNQIIYKKEDADLFILYSDEDKRWEITRKKDPESLAPLKRCRPECFLDLSQLDSRVIIDPSQEYVNKVYWRTWTGEGWREDKKLIARGPDLMKAQAPTCLFHLEPDDIRKAYTSAMEMLGHVWVYPGYNCNILADQRKGDPIFHDNSDIRFKSLGEFLPKRKQTLIQQSYKEWKAGVPQEEIQVSFSLWEPSTIYRLYWTSEEKLDVLEGWTLETKLILPKVYSHADNAWPNNKWIVFSKAYAPGQITLMGSGEGISTIIFVKEGAYALSASGVEYEILRSMKPGNNVTQSDQPDEDIVAEEGEEVAEGEAAPEGESTGEQFRFVSFGSFDCFNGYCYIRNIVEDLNIPADQEYFTLIAPLSITVYIAYFDPIPEKVREWHTSENWFIGNFKLPIIKRGGQGFTATEVRTRTFEKGRIVVRGNQGARCCIWFKPLPQKEFNVAQELLSQKPMLFWESKSICETFDLLRNRLGETRARAVILNTESWISMLLNAQERRAINKKAEAEITDSPKKKSLAEEQGKIKRDESIGAIIGRFVKKLQVELLEVLLSPEVVRAAVRRFPKIYDIPYPQAKELINTLLSMCRNNEKERLALVDSVPEVITYIAADVIEVWKYVTSIWNDLNEATDVVKQNPRLLLYRPQFYNLLEVLNRSFTEEYARARLKVSFIEKSVWEGWVDVVCAEPTSSEVEIRKWVGSLRSLEKKRNVFLRKDLKEVSDEKTLEKLNLLLSMVDQNII